MTTDERQELLESIQRAAHARCMVCGNANGHAPRLRFVPAVNGGVEASFQPSAADEGYRGILHGGVIGTLLDAAMTNCLFARGKHGVTADLRVRYRHPVTSDAVCFVHARVEREAAPFFVLSAELMQNGERKATAVGRFVVPQIEPGAHQGNPRN